MSEIPDIEVARYALRTFNVKDGRLMPVAMLVDAWKGGVCEAECVPNPWTMSYTYSALGALAALMGDDVPVPDRNHDAPAEGCHCGIYGCLTIERLRRQYPLECMDIVTVIAVEGKTIIGEIGLRTQAARIVAYWSPVKSVRKICADTCQGAKWFASLDDMLTAYRFEPDRQTEWPPLDGIIPNSAAEPTQDYPHRPNPVLGQHRLHRREPRVLHRRVLHVGRDEPAVSQPRGCSALRRLRAGWSTRAAQRRSRMITTTELFLALCAEFGCGRWMQTARLAELWLRFHPCGGEL